MSRVESLVGGRCVAVVASFAGVALLARQTDGQGQMAGRLQPGAGASCLPPTVSTGNFVCGPGGVQDLSVETLLACDLDGNRSPEVAALHGGRLVLFVNPDVGDEHVVVASGVRTLAAVPGESRFLFTTATGLAGLELQSGQVNVKFLEEGEPWTGARSLVGAPDGSLVLVGADGRELYRVEAREGRFPAPTKLFQARLAVRELQVFEWDGNAGLELAWLDARGLQVRNQDGTLLREHASTVPGGVLVPVANAGSKFSLAWVTRLADGSSYLFHLRPDLPGAYEGPLALGAQPVTSLAAGDLDADGDDDLLLGRPSVGTVERLTNHSELVGVPAFVGAEEGFSLLFADEFMPLGSGRVVCADLFNDRDSDQAVRPGIATLLLDPPGLRLVPQDVSGGFGFADPGQMPPSPLISAVRFESALWLAGCDAGVTGTRASWTLTAGPGWNAPAATHLELIVRASTQPGQAPGPIALHHSMTPIGPEGIAGTAVQFDGLEDAATSEDSRRVYFVQLRPVRLDTSERHIEQAWRWSVIGLSAHCDGLIWLGTLPGVIHQTAPILRDSCLPVLDCGFGIPVDTIGGRIYIPSAVPQVRVPGNGPGVLPIVWPWNY